MGLLKAMKKTSKFPSIFMIILSNKIILYSKNTIQ